MDVVWWGNLVEAGLWIGVGLSIAVVAGRRADGRRPYLILAGGFGLFGVSDVVEMWSGAWWKPWWLLLLKCGCALVIFQGIWQVARLTKTRPPDD